MSGFVQQTLFDEIPLADLPVTAAATEAIKDLALNSDNTERGAIYTRKEVVEFILDLVGYQGNKQLFGQQILEPSFGNGDFLFPIIDRLLLSWAENKGSTSNAFDQLKGSIRAVELHRKSFQKTRESVVQRLKDYDIKDKTANNIADKWLVQGDFLLEKQSDCFDYIVGNPPYVRQELIPSPLLAEYRYRYSTIYDRADLYIPFIERSLSLLNQNGQLGFICADRWMKNRYGGPLRHFISKGFHLKTYVDMVNTDAFHAEVSAYPAITIIAKSRPGATRIVHRPQINTEILASVSKEILSEKLPNGSCVKEMVGVVNGHEPWLIESTDQIDIIRKIEKKFPTLEEAGCKIGIGVATGADKAFIEDYVSMDVESDRKIPLVATRDIQTGDVVWQGKGVINPFADDGSLVNLNNYPRLAKFLEKRKSIIAKRHCAQKNPRKWYRTIDRIWPDLALRPKLLIPDIKGEANIVYESGEFYPHHNLYHVTSDIWDLRALQAVLLSSIARLFVATYSIKMRGGYLRFQAQYLRRIRIPYWKNVPNDLRQELITAAKGRDLNKCNKAAFNLYKLTKDERSALGGNGE